MVGSSSGQRGDSEMSQTLLLTLGACFFLLLALDRLLYLTRCSKLDHGSILVLVVSLLVGTLWGGMAIWLQKLPAERTRSVPPPGYLPLLPIRLDVLFALVWTVSFVLIGADLVNHLSALLRHWRRPRT
jgi:hypothetical protein